ncbi:MAG: 23S rRNA (pseudouridine(1915)-N(3))-methyltransferase RlmH [Rhodocyclaceae bacterium]|nr:23S rRNA (pseudouridine(1915)-N(3))-methyltransferase RlmH [Rhodocyclaceae bacterium]
MKLWVVAVGARQPSWVVEGFREYARRMPREMPLELIEIKPEPRLPGKPLAAVLAAEAKRIDAAVPATCQRIALDEKGEYWTTKRLAEKLQDWRAQGYDVAFLIGGPDGLAAPLKASAMARWSLSPLTLPHGLVRVILAEALYRAYSLLMGHPYHRP